MFLCSLFFGLEKLIDHNAFSVEGSFALKNFALLTQLVT
jgi:hypothetical protein